MAGIWQAIKYAWKLWIFNEIFLRKKGKLAKVLVKILVSGLKVQFEIK